MKKLILLASFILIQGCAPTSYLVKTPTPSTIGYKNVDIPSEFLMIFWIFTYKIDKYAFRGYFTTKS